MTSEEDVKRLFSSINAAELRMRAKRAVEDPRVQPSEMRAIIRELLKELQHEDSIPVRDRAGSR